MPEIEKIEPASAYPPEEGCYLRGNDYSPVAVVVILRWRRDKTPADIENMVRVAIESGAALAGTLQTENIGLEKVICNVVSNPNIRYLVVCGPESPGHFVGDAILALMNNGMDDRKRIIGTKAPTPYLFNIPLEFVERFRKQVTAIDLIDEGSVDVLRQAVCSCYQEKPTQFGQYKLYDLGAYPESPLSGKITWKVTRPSEEPKSNEERTQREKIQSLVERIRKASEGKKHPHMENERTAMTSKNKLKILFLCTGNSCRSQMAEGWARHLKGDLIEPYSAGIETHGLNPNAVEVMAEVGVDISGHHSKHVNELKDMQFDYVVTVCDNAHEHCPVFPAKTRVLHAGFDDPPRLAKKTQTQEQALNCYRRIRDEIQRYVEKLPEILKP